MKTSQIAWTFLSSKSCGIGLLICVQLQLTVSHRFAPLRAREKMVNYRPRTQDGHAKAGMGYPLRHATCNQ
jgi:hypothetical protein